MFGIVLLEPEIPHNTGNIARTCSATGATLHLIEPLGFSLQDKYLKRAGLDYWEEVHVSCHSSFQEFVSKFPKATLYFATTKATKNYAEFSYHEDEDVFFVFGKETAGIPEEILVQNHETCIRIPMRNEARSLNLSNAVAIVLYEALRQNNFEGLLSEGKLSKLSWEL